MKAIFLGTNGWFNTRVGNTICTLLETKEYHIIFDAGDGLYKIEQYIKNTKPILLFLSHLHLDHITGFHTLNKFTFPQGIKIYGQKGIKKLLSNIICSPYTADLNKLPYPVELLEIEEGKHNLPFSVSALSLFHSVDCLGYRLAIENKIITYCCDTGPGDNVITLAKEADLFIAECSLKSGQDNKVWPHLNPEMAAKIAKEAKAKRLVLTHFNPFLFPTLEDRKIAEEKAQSIFLNSFSASDDLKMDV